MYAVLVQDDIPGACRHARRQSVMSCLARICISTAKRPGRAKHWGCEASMQIPFSTTPHQDRDLSRMIFEIVQHLQASAMDWNKCRVQEKCLARLHVSNQLPSNMRVLS